MAVVSHPMLQAAGSQLRLRYAHAVDLKISETTDSRTREKQYFVKSASTGEVLLFGEQEYALFCALDGETTFAALELDCRARWQISISRADFDSFLQVLIETGMLLPLTESGEAQAVKPVVESDASEPLKVIEQIVEHVVDGPAVPSAASSAAPKQTAARTFRVPLSLKLGNPSWLLNFLNKAFGSLRVVVWLLLPLSLFAGLIAFHRQTDLLADLGKLHANVSLASVVIANVLLMNLGARLAQAWAIHAFGGRVSHIGLMLAMGFVPRFFIDTSSLKDLPRRGQLWAHSAPWLTRLTFFALGTIIWAMYRSGGSQIATYALLIGQMGFWIAAVTAIPLFPGAGYHWLAHYLEQPQLRERALRLFFGARRKGRPVPAPATGAEKWGLLFFAVGTIICCAALFAGGFLYLGVSLEQEYRGTGVAMFFGLFTVAVLWLLGLRAGVSRLRVQFMRQAAVLPAGAGEVEGAAVVPLRPGLGARRLAEGQHLRDWAQAHAPTRNYRPLAVWALILLALAGVGMIPYSYDAGGQFVVLPNARYEVRARVSGELVEIRVDEGDKVSANQILAVVSQWQQQRDLSVARANLDKAQANLKTLEESPKPEEVALAQKQVENAASRVPFTKAQLDRQATLVKTGATSGTAYDMAKSDYDQAVTALSVAKANYELVKTGPMPSEIEAARAEVKSLTEEVKFREGELERTFLRADKSGTVVTQKLRYLKGKYLKEGDLFAEIEDHAVARSDIDVPETDVPEVKLGSAVRVKSWALSEDPRVGTVVAIAPLAEDRGYGRVVRVSTDIPNDEGLLRPGMTGYAKIEGPDMPLWRAYTRLFVRFFLVEVWSWIP